MIKRFKRFIAMSDARYRQWFAIEGQFGTELGRRSGPVFWSYRGWGRVDSTLIFRYMEAKRAIRKLAIGMGLQKPYSW